MGGMSDEPPSIKTLLVVEDDLAIVSRLTKLPAVQAASQVIHVSGCLTTLKFLRYYTPDLILLDERLLHSNGSELGPRLAVMKDLQAMALLRVDGESAARTPQAWHRLR